MLDSLKLYGMRAACDQRPAEGLDIREATRSTKYQFTAAKLPLAKAAEYFPSQPRGDGTRPGRLAVTVPGSTSSAHVLAS